MFGAYTILKQLVIGNVSSTLVCGIACMTALHMTVMHHHTLLGISVTLCSDTLAIDMNGSLCM